MVAKPNRSSIPDDRIATYDRLIVTRPGVERKGATIPYTSLNGHMTSYLTPEGSLVLHLSPADRERFIEAHHATLHVAYGVTQKEFVAVPYVLFADTPAMAPWFAASLDWIATLKPKPTKKPR
jgi:hypothetical protein